MQKFVINGLKSDINIEPKLVTTSRLSHKICCEIIVKMLWTLLLFLFNQNSCNSQITVNIFIRMVKIG